VAISTCRVKIDFPGPTCEHTAMTDPSSSRLRTLWLGDPARVEFAATAEVLSRESDCIRSSLDQAESAGADTPIHHACDLIVVAESFPDELSAFVVARLRSRHPAARWVRVVGPWCDGEVRSASPPPATLRIAWHRAPHWFARQFQRLRAGGPTEFDDPATFDEADRLHVLRRESTAVAGRGPLGVWAEEPAAREWLVDVLAGYSRAGQLHPENAAGSRVKIAVCDFPTADGLAERLADVRKAYPQAALVVLAGFIRPRDVRTLYDSGVAMVLAKPVSISDLEAAIHAAASRLS
jgi:DNA-binding NarL/FixJ family response regulator